MTAHKMKSLLLLFASIFQSLSLRGQEVPILSCGEQDQLNRLRTIFASSPSVLKLFAAREMI
jgi:hypothetical protein